ncbi:MAG: acetate uptake transporter [Gammaproteobacteria bacterium]
MNEVSETTTPKPVATVSHIGVAVAVGVQGFAMTAFTLGIYTSGFIDKKGVVLVLALAAFYGGLTQFIAGFFALAKGKTFEATFMTAYGAFWFSYIALKLFVVPHAGAAADQALTFYLIMWTVITFLFTIAALATNKFVFWTFVELTCTFIVVAIGSAYHLPGVTRAGGGLEMLVGGLAWYIVTAGLVNDTAGKTVISLFPFKKPVFGT